MDGGRPEHLREACEASIRRLGVEAIGPYRFHRPDPNVPYAESIGATRRLQEEGKIRMAGIGNDTVAQIDEARSIVDLASVRNEFPPKFSSGEDELRHCADLGATFLPWSPLGGISSASQLGDRHDALRRVAEERGVSPQQVCLAWVIGLDPSSSRSPAPAAPRRSGTPPSPVWS